MCLEMQKASTILEKKNWVIFDIWHAHALYVLFFLAVTKKWEKGCAGGGKRGGGLLSHIGIRIILSAFN